MPRNIETTVPGWKLERFLLGELPADENQKLQAIFESSPKDQKRLAELEKEFAAIRARLPFRKIFPNQRKSDNGSAAVLRSFVFSRTALAFASVPLVIGIYAFFFTGQKPATIASVQPTQNQQDLPRYEKTVDIAGDVTRGITDGDQSATEGRIAGEQSGFLAGQDGRFGNGPVNSKLKDRERESKNDNGADHYSLNYRGRDQQKAQSGKKGSEKHTPGIERKIIRTGNVFAEVPNVKDALLKIKASLAAHGGHIENENISKDSNDHAYANLVLRIPAERFEDFMTNSSAFGKIINQSSNSQDATREYFDTELRLKNDVELKNRLVEVLRTRTGKLSEILEIETELARVTERIELSKGSLRYLDTVVGMSRIDLQLREPDSVIESGRPSTLKQIATGFGRAWYLFTDLLTFAITSLGVVLPLSLLGFVGWKLLRRYRRGV